MITLFRDPIFSTIDKMFDSAEFHNSPKTKINKTNEGYKISICVPGLTKSDLKISTKEGILKISYEMEEYEETKLFISNFVKTYRIPDDVVEKNILGKVENGILELVLPIDNKKSLERTISLN